MTGHCEDCGNTMCICDPPGFNEPLMQPATHAELAAKRKTPHMLSRNPTGRDRTHWLNDDGTPACWIAHVECAEHKVEQLTADIAALEAEVAKYKPNVADDVGQCRRCGLTVSKWELEGAPNLLHDGCLYLEQKEYLTADLAAQTARAETAEKALEAFRWSSHDGGCFDPAAKVAREWFRWEPCLPGEHNAKCLAARAILAGGAKVVRCPECLQDAPTAAEIDHGDDCEAAHG